MALDFHIAREWRGPLAAAGLDRFESLIEGEPGRCVSHHDRGQAFRVLLEDGRTVFLKRDVFAAWKDIFADLLRLHRPLSPGMHELRALRGVAGLGIPTPRPLAWGERRAAGLPRQSVLVMDELEGEPLHKLLRRTEDPRERREALTACGRTAKRLSEAGFVWPDMVPKHFHVGCGELAGVLDLARMRRTARRAASFLPAQVEHFCSRLHRRGGTDEDVRAFLDAVDRDDILDRRVLLGAG